MKKTLTVILALCMILSICSFSVSADPVGTPITSEAEFLAMKEDGYYYLANDITITQSYGVGDKFFTGVFDGNGKTVTLTGEPMFLEFCGKAKDLTIKGEVVASHDKDNGYWARGAFACMVSGEGTITLYNIVNNANITGFEDQSGATGLLGNAYTGGIIGALDNQSVGTEASIEIINCVNNGNVKGYHCAGGIAGILYVNDSDYSADQTAKVINCVNNGQVDGIHEYTGGIVGRVYYCVDALFTGCINNGVVTGYGNTGGIIGHTTVSSIIMRACQNNGAVSVPDDQSTTSYAGGLIGYAQGTKDSNHSADYGEFANQIEFCINTGAVTGQRRTGGIVGSSGAEDAYGITQIRYCINTGDVTNRGNGTSHAQCNAGGIQGYGYGSSTTPQYVVMSDCITTGNVEARQATNGIAAYFLGYISSDKATIKNNSGSGVLTSAADKAYCIGWNNNSGTGYSEETLGNKIPATNLYKIAAEAGAESTKDFQNGIFEINSLLSGEAIAAFNAAYKQITGATTDCMTQKIDGGFNPQIVQLDVTAPEFPAPEQKPDTTEEETTEAPKVDDTTKAPDVETTEAPVDATEPTPQQTEAPSTTEPAKSGGCGGYVAGGIVIVALLGTALVIKKKD